MAQIATNAQPHAIVVQTEFVFVIQDTMSALTLVSNAQQGAQHVLELILVRLAQ
jgi:hypothetical protein